MRWQGCGAGEQSWDQSACFGDNEEKFSNKQSSFRTGQTQIQFPPREHAMQRKTADPKKAEEKTGQTTSISTANSSKYT